MKKPSKVQLVILCGLGLIIIGGSIIVTWAYKPLWIANEWIQNPTCADIMICIPSMPITFIGKDSDGNVISTLTGTTKFSSRGQFAMNSPIYYNINLTIDRPEFINEIYFVVSSKNEDHSYQVETNPNKFFQDMKQMQRLIDMKKISENKFHRNGFWTISNPIEQVFVVLIVSPDNSVSLAGTTDVLFTLVTPEVKAQDDANIESRITNKTVLGLTWMGIGLGFALLGADFIARSILKE